MQRIRRPFRGLAACFVGLYFVSVAAAASFDGEDGTTAGWDIYDATPAGAVVANVFDADRNSLVIETSGAPRSQSNNGNGFRLRNPDFTPWANSAQFVIEWSMRFDAPYIVYVDVQTTAGQRYLTYEPVDASTLGTGTYVTHGLGTSTDDGNWVTIARDLQADLAAGQPGVQVTEVNAFLVRGIGRLDDIQLRDDMPIVNPVYENAENGTTDGWDIYDATPAGATLDNVFDSDRNSRVIEITGADRNRNGFRRRNDDLTPWANTSQFVIEWSMRFDDSYIIYVDVQTTAGQRYLTYEPVDIDILGTGTYVSHGLGTNTDEGRWVTIARDLQADLAAGQPGAVISQVNAFLVRGSGRLDDIQLHTEMPAAPSVYSDAEDGTTAGWDIYDATPAGASLANVFDPDRNSNVIETSGAGRSQSENGNGFRLRKNDSAPWANTTQFIIEWSMRFDESYIIYVDVQTTAGQRYLTYEPVNGDALGTGTYILHGLGTNTDDGNWVTVTRDLRADLADGQPGVEITQVNAFLVRGSGRLDDVALRVVPKIENLDIDVESNLLTLTWSAPLGDDIAGVEIRRRDDGQYPQNPTDGTFVMQVPAEQQVAVDTFVNLGGMGDSVYYSVFSFAAPGVYADGVRTGIYCDAGVCVTVPDIRPLTNLESAADIDARRAQLVTAIWGVETLPAQLPDSVADVDPLANPTQYFPPNAIRTEELRVDPGDPFFIADFRMRLYSPATSNGKLVIYHGGHRGFTEERKPVIERFLAEGYGVLEASMPMAGANWNPIYHPPVRMFHESLAPLDRPMRFFVEQLSVALNYLMPDRGFDDVYMVGISGGGWSTVVYAALDPRIRASYPVAGSYPFYLRDQLDDSSGGDFEQTNPSLYQHATYLELYILGSAGRRQLQVYNVFDDCCFPGTYSNTFRDHVQAEAASVGGSFDIALDDTFVGHKISDNAVELIVTDIAGN